MFAHLDVQTEFGNGYATVAELIARAQADQVAALALTDVALHGLTPFLHATHAAAIRPLIGARVQLAPGQTLVLLVRSAQGYRNLLTLLALAAHQDLPQITTADLCAHTAGLVCLVVANEGPLATAAAHDIARITRWYARHCASAMVAVSPHVPADQRARLRTHATIPLVATNAVCYADPAHQQGAALLQAGRTNTAPAPPTPLPHDHCAPATLAQRMGDDAALLDGIALVLDQCQWVPEPRLTLPALSRHAAADVVYRMARRGLAQRGLGRDPRYIERISAEIAAFAAADYLPYLLLVARIVAWCRRNDRVCLVRGSANAALTLYAFGASACDPVAHDLIFDRFFSLDRHSAPDIDIDIASEDRPRVLAMLQERFGAAAVAIPTVWVRHTPRTALKTAAQLLAQHPDRVDALHAWLPEYPLHATATPPLACASDQHLWQAAQQIVGRIRRATPHPCGVVVANQPLAAVTTLVRPPPLAQVGATSDDLAAMGLAKLDLLSSRVLARIAQTLALIDPDHRPQLAAIPLDDAATYAMLARGDTTDVFQLGSAGMRHTLRAVAPTTFADLCVVIALFRPGAKTQIGRYCAQRARGSVGTDPIRQILAATAGVAVYQEQIMALIVWATGSSWGHSYALLKQIATTTQPEWNAACSAHGTDPDIAAKIWTLITAHAQYSFARAHAVGYAWISYISAYLYRTYPTAATTALLRATGVSADRLLVAMQRGVVLREPCVHRSGLVPTSDGPHLDLGLALLVGTATASAIIAARDQGPYQSLADLAQRVALTNPQRTALAHSGALDAIEGSRAAAYAAINAAPVDQTTAYRNEQRQTMLALAPCHVAALVAARTTPPLAAQTTTLNALACLSRVDTAPDRRGRVVHQVQFHDDRTYLDGTITVQARRDAPSLAVGHTYQWQGHWDDHTQQWNITSVQPWCPATGAPLVPPITGASFSPPPPPPCPQNHPVVIPPRGERDVQ